MSKLKKIKKGPNYSVENFSSNIVSSEGINQYLNDGTNLIKDKSNAKSTIMALRNYFRKILKKSDVNAKMIRNSIEPLNNNMITIINSPGLDFLRSTTEKRILISYKKSINLIDVLIYATSKHLAKDSMVDIYTKLSKYNQTYIDSILSGNIPEIDTALDISKNYAIPKEIYSKLIVFYNDIIKVLSQILRVNILFYIPTINISDPLLTTFYLSDYNSEYKTIGVKIIVPYISRIARKKNEFSKEHINKIYYENLLELDAYNHLINKTFSNTIVNKIKGELNINLGNVSDKINIGDEIIFNPLDREGELSVIEVQINQSLKKTFLLGKTGNLYEDDDNANDLVGNLIFMNKSSYDANIYWAEGYLENLISN